MPGMFKQQTAVAGAECGGGEQEDTNREVMGQILQGIVGHREDSGFYAE